MDYPQEAHEELERLDREKCALLDSHKSTLRTSPELSEDDRLTLLADFETALENVLFERRDPYERQIEEYDTYMGWLQQRSDTIDIRGRQ